MREKQTEIIAAFKENYSAKFGPTLPRFIPEASLLAVQPVMQTYEFSGFHAPVPLFQPPLSTVPGTCELGQPAVYQTIVYDAQYPNGVAWQGRVTMQAEGVLNAWRLVTKNVLAVLVDQQSEICWHNQYLVVPVGQPLSVHPGDQVDLAIAYQFGAELTDLWDGISLRSVSSCVRHPVAA